MEDLIDAALVTTTSAWAAWLGTHKEFEPDHTWVQVVVGNALCMGAAKAHARVATGQWTARECDIWRAFLLGGAPIIVGEIAQWLTRRAERQRYIAARQ